MSKDTTAPLSLKLDSKVLKYFVAGIKKDAFKVNRYTLGNKPFTTLTIRNFHIKAH